MWNGTAFSDCPQDEILLRHSLYSRTEGTAGTCNNGDIVGQSLGVQGNHYISQLNVTVTPDIVGKTITCVYDALSADHSNDMTLFTEIIPGNVFRSFYPAEYTALCMHLFM